MSGGAEFPVKAVLDDKQIDALIAALTKAGKTAGMTEKEIADINAELRKTGKEGVKNVNDVNQSMNNMVNNTLKKVGSAVLAAFAFDRIVQFGKEVIRVTSEFQKLEAVLTNTLGSKSEAQRALKQIQDFAANTPFSVLQLTENFVKLANRGVKPTTEELTGLGDLSATLGKDIGQLVEALLDVNNPERWKELGIVSQTAGDKVRLSFRGVTVETERTVQGVTNAAVALGKMEGVAGSMEAISKTLGGQISNLGDAYDKFLNTVGDGNSGILSDSITLLQKLLTLATDFIKTGDQVAADVQDSIIAAEIDKFEEFAKGFETSEEALAAYGEVVKQTADTLNTKYGEAVQKQMDIEVTWKDRILGGVQAKELQHAALEKTRVQLGNEWRAYQNVIPALEDYLKAQKKTVTQTTTQLGIIEKLNADLKKFKEAKEKAFTKDEIAFFNMKIEETERALKRLQKLGADDSTILSDKPLTDFAKSLEKNIGKESEKAFKRAERAMDEFTDKYEADQKKQRDAAAKTRELKEQGERELYDRSIDFANSLFEASQQRAQQEIESLHTQRDQELENAGTNEEAKDKIRKVYAKKEAILRAKQAESERQQAIFNMLVNQGPAVARAFRDFPFYIAIPIAALVAAQFAQLLTKSKSAPAPKFARGVFDLKGPGTGTSDSIPAHLSRGESVITENRSRRYPGLVQALVEGSDADIMKAMALQLRGDLFNPPAASDTLSLRDDLRAIKEAIENKQEMHLSINEKGFKKWAHKGNYWTEYLNQEYRS